MNLSLYYLYNYKNLLTYCPLMDVLSPWLPRAAAEGPGRPGDEPGGQLPPRAGGPVHRGPHHPRSRLRQGM